MNAISTPGLDLKAPAYLRNPRLIAWVSDMATLCKPAAIHWCDGSQEEYQMLCQRLVDAGTFTKPVRIGQRSVGWPSHEVQAINAARIAGLSIDELKTLVDRLHAKRLEIMKQS
jgi:GTP-dependent phosphoenolpyruvate carboxykinase